MTTKAGIEQALFWVERGEFFERACSPDWHLHSEWPRQAEQLCRGFGTPHGNSPFPLAIFARPFDAATIAVVQVNAATPGRVAFRILLVPRWLYVHSIRDPFAVSDRFPPDWSATGPLPTLDWPDQTPPQRRIRELQKILQTGNSPLLLGAVQALVDGCRVAFRGDSPNNSLIRNLWSLLPESARAELWPATFVCSNTFRFDLLVAENLKTLEFERYLTEDVVIDYPEGQYEFALQYAIEHGDQTEVDRLFGRRSTRQFLRFILWLLVISVLAYLGIQSLFAP